MTETKNENKKPESIDERLATMGNESIKFPNNSGAPAQEAKPVVEEKKVETAQEAKPTVEEKKAEVTPVASSIVGESQMEALKTHKPTIAFVAGLLIGAILVSLF